jgi:RecD/TraA family predicted helicase
VYGFGEFTYNRIRERVIQNLEWQTVVEEFPDLNFNMISKLMRHYTSTEILIQDIKTNPYKLTKISGIGFTTADKIAEGIGFDMNSPFRIHAGIAYAIEQCENNGDTYVTAEELLRESYTLLKVKKTLIRDELLNSEDIVNIDGKFALKKTYEIEKNVAETLLSMHNNNSELYDFNVEEFIAKQEDQYKIKLTDQQKSFFYNFKKSRVTFLVGYAGCGKSMLQKLLINLLEQELHLDYLLLAPTGKASKVLSKYTKRRASTIHKAAGIGLNREEFGEVVIPQSVIIVDETSMGGVEIIKILLEKLVNPNVRILFIGDDFQIPSVDRGNFLYDCINSGSFPVTKLDIVFRQSEGGILDVVTKIRKGEKFLKNNDTGVKKFGDNCIFVCCPQEKMEKGYKHYYNELLGKYSPEDIMVLSPTKKRDLGTHAINRNLQEIVNPRMGDEPEITRNEYGEEMAFRKGDFVINVKNSYRVKDVCGASVDIMNGDTGVITNVDEENKKITIDFDDFIVEYSSSDFEKLLHSGCLTMHKSQGSAAEAVVAIADKSHTYQLNANLLYTALTRAKEDLVTLCQPKVINEAMKKVENLRRNTFLGELLKGDIA